jgi:hypothetical protein
MIAVDMSPGTSPLPELLLVARQLDKRIVELEEALTRNMNDTFNLVNDSNARVHGFERRIAFLETLVKGLINGGINTQTICANNLGGGQYDAGSAWPHSDNQTVAGFAGNTRIGENSLGQGSNQHGTGSTGQGDRGCGSSTPSEEDGQEKW